MYKKHENLEMLSKNILKNKQCAFAPQKQYSRLRIRKDSSKIPSQVRQ